MKRIVLGGMIALVVVALAGVGLAVTRPDLVPAWARIAPAPKATEDSGLFCKEHGVPEKFCTLCHEELKKTLMLCKEHGDIPEDICTLCHPEVQKKYNIEMCPKGHGLPKHFCTECGTGTSASLNLPDDGWCATHNKPEALCAECLADPKSHVRTAAEGTSTAKVCRVSLPTVRLASAQLAQQVGIETASVVEEDHAHSLSANAETAYDANRYADISPRVDGFLREVRADLGQAVARGEVLAVVDSAAVSAAKTQYLSAHDGLALAQATYDRIRALRGAVAGKQEIEAQTGLNQAKAAAMDAEQKLRNFGFDDDALKRILKVRDTKGSLEIVAPIGGTVVLRHAVRGEAVQATTQLFAVADTSKMWLWIDVYEVDVARVAMGQAVSFAASGTEATAYRGKITWLGNEVNEKTRTTRVRAEVENADGRLRANQFGRAEIQLGAEHRAIVVPRESIQRQEKTDLVFLPEGEGVYRPQRVLVRPTDRRDVVEVAWGLKPGQRVVTTGSFLLKTEIMKGAIGAGCCE